MQNTNSNYCYPISATFSTSFSFDFSPTFLNFFLSLTTSKSISKTVVSKIPFFKLSYPMLMHKADLKPYKDKKCSCEICKLLNNTSYFKSRDTVKTLNILNGTLDCSSNHIISLFECKNVNIVFPM